MGAELDPDAAARAAAAAFGADFADYAGGLRAGSQRPSALRPNSLAFLANV